MNYYHTSYDNRPLSQFIQKVPDDTMFDFVSKCSSQPAKWYGNCFTIDQMRDIFRFVYENNYPLLKEFYECSARNLGGKL